MTYNFTLKEKMNFISNYTNKPVKELKLLDIAGVFVSAQIILGKDSELFDRFVGLFWKNFRR